MGWFLITIDSEFIGGARFHPEGAKEDSGGVKPVERISYQTERSIHPQGHIVLCEQKAGSEAAAIADAAKAFGLRESHLRAYHLKD